MKRWSIHGLQGGLGTHAPAWDELQQRLFSANPMLDSRFVDALLQHFGNGSERLCVLHAGMTLQAMCILRPRGMGRWSTFLPAQAQIGPVLLNEADAVPSLLNSLPGIQGQIDFLCNDPAFGDLALEKTDHIGSLNHALTMSIRLTGDFDAYWSARPKTLIQNLRRYEKRLASEHIASRFTCITEAQEVKAAVARYSTLETQGWKGKLGTALSIDNAQGAFYSDVASRFSESGQACVYELWFGDKLAASRIAILANDTIVMLKTTYDEAFNRHAPGRLLLRATVEHAFGARPGGLIEFYTNANADQLAWATDQRWIKHVSFFRNALAARLFAVIRTGRRVLSFSAAASHIDSNDIVSVFRHPDDCPPDVLQLFEKAERESVEFGSTWYRNLVDSVYSDHDGVRIYVLHRKGLPVAALPIVVSRNGLRRHADALSNYYTALYSPALAPETTSRDLVPLIAAIRRDHSPLGWLKFSPMDPQSDAYAKLLGALKMSGLLPFEFFCFGNWFQKVTQEWPDYFKDRSGVLRSTVKRMGKKFAAEGGRLELIRSGVDVERGLKAYEHVYAASWKEAEPFVSFMPGLVRACAERGWLRLGVAWLKDEPIAAQVWIVAGGKAYIYKLAYHEGQKAYAPGTLLTTMLMQHVIEQDCVAEVDYLIGDDPYKQTWMSDRRERWGLIAYNPHTLTGLLGLSRELGGRVIKRLLSNLRSKRTLPAE